ncbi:signal protein [Corallococcus sicarius]|uniref:Signal protein n=1 Tax=Corallococcus sicarius TaxID=2316726 RepID=A0A3A8MVH5_9BACT|nr:signal protein [Corallococcus sicarius]RKH33731.1 signal protein [Corallococcus sicarius]
MALAEDSRNASRPNILRRTYLLDREFQLKYILLLTCIGSGSMLLFGVLALQAQGMAEEGGLSATESLWWLTGAGTVGMGVALALFGLLFTHRVAGPVHVMSLYVAALAAGRYPRLRPLRRKDELRAFFGRFSEAVDRIRQREADEALALEQALQVLKPLGTTPEAREALATLEALRARKRQAVDTSAPSGAFKSVA